MFEELDCISKFNEEIMEETSQSDVGAPGQVNHLVNSCGFANLTMNSLKF